MNLPNVKKTRKTNFSDGLLQPHNQQAYQKIKDAFLDKNRVLIHHATGTGKSFIALKFLKDFASRNNKQILFVTPRNILQQDFLNLCKSVQTQSDVERHINITTSTYQGLKKHINSHYDIIIFDEAHFLGAPIWGKVAKKLLNTNPNAKVIGLTATPERGDGFNIYEQFFDGEGSESELLPETAISSGILPMPKYWLAECKFGNQTTQDEEFIKTNIAALKTKYISALPEEKAQIQKILKDLHTAQRFVAKTPNFKEVLQNVLKTEGLSQGKFIVFCPHSNQTDDKSEKIMKQYMQSSENWFKGITNTKPNVYGIHNSFTKKTNQTNLDNFINDKSNNLRLMFSVDMLTFGKHIPDIDGIIMLRPTSSKIVYFQQLGRVLSAGNNKTPVVIDLVGNLNYSDYHKTQNLETNINQTQNKKGNNSYNPLNTQINFNFQLVNKESLEFVAMLKENISQYQNSQSFLNTLKQIKTYLTNNPGHTGAIPQSATDGEGNAIGKKMYYLSRVRKGLYHNAVFGEKEFRKFDEILPGWDNYQKVAFNFEEFYSYFSKFIEAKHKFYDNLEVPKEHRLLSVPARFRIDGYKLGVKVRNLKFNMVNITPSQKQKILSLNPNFFKASQTFDFGEFYGYYKKFITYKQKEYDQNNTPQQLRDFHVPQVLKINGYPLGVRTLSLKTGKTKITEKQTEALSKLNPDWQTLNRKFDFEKFLYYYKKFIEQKKSDYESGKTQTLVLTVPARAIIDGYTLGRRMISVVEGDVVLTESQYNQLSAVNPDWRTRKQQEQTK